jgi:NTE family protein
MTRMGDDHYWDGGLFDNTPLRPLIEMLTPDEAASMPIVLVDLFPSTDALPRNLVELKNRMLEISFENRFWDDFGGPSGLVSFAQMLSDLNAELPADSALRQHEQFHRLMCYRALRNLHVINSPHVPMTGGMDFSAYGVQQRFEAGYAAAGELLAKGPLAPPAPPSAAAAKKRRMMEPA